MRSVVDVLVGHIKRDDFGALAIDADMEFALGTALGGLMRFKQPFAGAAQFQSGAVDDQVKFVRSNPRRVENSQSTRPPAQPRMIWNRQVDLQHSHNRSDQAFALAKRQSKHGA